MTVIIGLTGSIGMGKSTVARQYAARGCLISDADAITHRLMQPGGAVFAPIAARFPQVIVQGRIDRRKLGAEVFDNPTELRWLEGIIHPQVRAAHQQDILRARRMGFRAVVLEVPLLFETGLDHHCDVTVTVTAPDFLQRQRVLARPGMTEEKFRHILAQQLPDAQKRRRADWVIQTGLGKRHSGLQVSKMLKDACRPRRIQA